MVAHSRNQLSFHCIEDLFTHLPPECTQFYVGLSGGMDSVVLLHVLHHFFRSSSQTAHGFSLTALHANHQIQKDAEHFENFCKQLCERYHIPFITERLTIIRGPQTSLEAVLREARYQFFQKHLPPKACLLTAHHANDQAETVLLQLLRGAGIKGLSGMKMLSSFFDVAFHARPFLTYSRQAIFDYAQEKKLKWVEDASNEDKRFSRNFLRHQVLPLLEIIQPGVLKTLARSAKHCEEAQSFIDDIIQKDYQNFFCKDTNSFSLDTLKKNSYEKFCFLMRYALEQARMPTPNKAKLHELFQQIHFAKINSRIRVEWQNKNKRYLFCVYQEKLFLLSEEKYLPISFSMVMTEKMSPVDLPFGAGQLRIEFFKGKGIRYNANNIYRISCNEKGSNQLWYRPLGRNKRQRLKKLWQEWAIPPWVRARTPLLFENDELVAVMPFNISADHQANENEMGIILSLRGDCA